MSCELCRSTGWVHTKLRADQSMDFTFICGCPAGQTFRPGKAGTTDRAAYWTKELESKYITFAELERKLSEKK